MRVRATGVVWGFGFGFFAGHDEMEDGADAYVYWGEGRGVCAFCKKYDLLFFYGMDEWKQRSTNIIF